MPVDTTKSGSQDSVKDNPGDKATLSLLFPKGGEIYALGDSLRVAATAEGNGRGTINAVDVFLSPDGGRTWGMLSHQPLPVAAESQIYYAWKIPAYFTADGKVSSLAENGECVIRVAQRNTGDSLKTSISGKFLIEDTVFIRLASPLGGESFRVGDTLRIAWSTKYDPEFPVDAVDVKMSADSGKTWAYLRPGSILPESRYWGLFPWVVADSISVLGKKAGIVGNPGVCVRVEQYTTTDPKHSFQSGMISILPR